MVYPLFTLLLYSFNGFIGGLLHSFISARTAKEIVSFNNLKFLVIGLLAGYFYYFASVNYGLPDSVMAIVVGYTGKDFVEKVITRLAI